MSLYEKYKDEAEFRDKFVRPLLNRLGFYGVAEQHGSNEFGKDFVFSELHRLGGMRHYAAQVKHEKKISQGASVDGLLSQIKQAFSKPFKRADSPRECHVASVYAFNSGEITDGAKEQMLAELAKERYGDNVHFLDGERLESLGQWATLQSDANARSRLLGLRATFQFLLVTLNKFDVKEQPEYQPFFIHGIELYLSEPVLALSDDAFINGLLVLWDHLQLAEATRKILVNCVGNPTKMKENVAKVKDGIMVSAKLIETLRNRIDDTLSKLKPLIEE
jgi:hypothetical protein